MGEGDGVEADGGSGIAQRVAGARVLQLVDGADVARAQLGDGDLLLAADEVDGVDALLGVRVGVEDGHARL